MPRWTAANIPPLTGKTAIVTGANSGLGFQTARQLTRHGARVILACRDMAKAKEAARQIRELAPGVKPEVGQLDLANLTSVQEFAARFNDAESGLDILVNNAGVMAIPYRTTADGFEMQFGINHLGHFALTGLLLPALIKRPGARVVSVSSQVALAGRLHFEDLQSKKHYNNWLAYAQSKLANLLFIQELQRRSLQFGWGLIAAAAHPGYADTGLQAAGPAAGNQRMLRLTSMANRLFAQSAANGALPQLFAATASAVRGGDYFGPDGLLHIRGYPVRETLPKRARDQDVAQRLWQVSEQLTEVRFHDQR